MKKILWLGMSLLMTAVVLTGCKKDEEEPKKLSVSTSALTAEAGTGSATFDITSNVDWTVASDAAWASVSPASGKGDGKISIAVSANTGDERTATITVTGGPTPKTVELTQAEGEEDVPAPQVIVVGNGSKDYRLPADLHLEYPNTYILDGFVFVPEGRRITIDPGVVIKGKTGTSATLVVLPGGTIMAQGTKDAPIVFTSQAAPGSRKPGDWGGVILMGKARNNQNTMPIEGVGSADITHGGTIENDNSGVLSYVRIEFAGYEYSVDNEINGLTMGSVGSGTQIDHIQVSHSGDDSFEWFGGSVNANHLVAFRGWDDDFDADFGFSGKVQYGLIVRDPQVADKSASNGFESDNNGSATAQTPFTSAVFANVSSFGPVTDPANYVDKGNVNGSSPAGVFQAGIQLRRNTRLSLFNSVAAGWPIGLIIENDSKGGDIWLGYNGGDAVVSGVVLAGMQANYQDKAVNGLGVVKPENGTETVGTYFTRAAAGNQTFATIAELKLSAAPGLANPVTIPAADSPLATGAVWTDAKVSTGFVKTDYIGAFGPTETAASNWTTGWTEFDPQNKVY